MDLARISAESDKKNRESPFFIAFSTFIKYYPPTSYTLMKEKMKLYKQKTLFF